MSGFRPSRVTGEVIAEAYINAVAEFETTLKPQPLEKVTKRERQLGKALANGCIDVAYKPARIDSARSRFWLAYKSSASLRERSPEQFYHKPGMSTFPEIALLLFTRVERRNKTKVTDPISMLHTQVVAGIQHLLHDTEACPTYEPAGIPAVINEYTAIGLISRRKSPNQLMFPALLHHNEGAEHETNYDSFYIESEGNTATAYPVQAKLGCFGLCNSSHQSSRKRRFRKRLFRDLEGYNSNIRIISGCCDMGIERIKSGDKNSLKYDLTIPYLLCKEDSGEATKLEREILDLAGDALLNGIRRPNMFAKNDEAS